MKLSVDEMLYCKDDCLFAKQKWSDEEQVGVDRMFEMMMASKQQLLLREAMTHEKTNAVV